MVEARERNALLSKVRNASGATVMVLHLDEMQLFCDFPLAWERCRDKRRVTTKDLAQYKLICPTAGWAKIADNRMRLAFTGTSTTLGYGVQLASEVKVNPVNTGNFSAAMVAKTVQEFFG